MENDLPVNRDLFPPEEFQIMNYSEKNFVNIGHNHLRFFINNLNLKPDADVLEIGSGNGRIASALTTYLSDGTYWGLEIMKPFVDWCSKAYQNYPNFRFQHIDVFNLYYNKLSITQPKDYTFPFPDNHFDFIFLTSVFTHMRTTDVDNYLKEIARMLRPGGISFITYFLINAETLKLIEQQKSHREFQLLEEHLYTDNPQIPESAIALDEDFVIQLYQKHNLVIDKNGVHYGRWRNPNELKRIKHGQDRVIARKPSLHLNNRRNESALTKV
jgi:SAM-dependent methyltransferase